MRLDIHGRIATLLAVMLMGSIGLARASNFPVSGTLTINGTPGTLPAGASFGDSTYTQATGLLSQGTFTIPQGTVSFESQYGPVVATYQFTQTNTSTGQVDAGGVAALSKATMRMAVVSATVSGFPIPIGICVFEPIDLFLVGTGAASGMDVSDPDFTIPEVAPLACGGYGGQINAAIAGGNKAIDLHLEGDFSPPAGGGGGAVFADGFE